MTDPFDPFAPPPEAAYPRQYAAVPPPGAPPPVVPATRPPVVPAFPRHDPFLIVGWTTHGAARARVAASFLALMLLLLPVCAGLWAEDVSWERDERRRYVVATGTVVVEDGDAVMRVSSPETGRVDVRFDELMYPGEPVTVLVDPDDPSDYLLWEQRADPWLYFWTFAIVAVLAAGLCLTTVLVHRRRRLDLSGVEAVALRLDGADPPPPLPRGTRLTGPRTYAWPALALGLGVVAFALAAAVPAVAPDPQRRTTTGTVTGFADGLRVRFSDERIEEEWERPLSEAEARGRAPGETMTVSYVLDPGEHSTFGQAAVGTLAAMAGASALALGVRSVRTLRTRRRVTSTDPVAVEVTAWTRVRRGRAWLVLAPVGSRRMGDAVAVPLDRDFPVPPAVTGRLWLHGRLRAGEWVLVRAPDGGVLLPAGPVRGTLVASLRSDLAAPFPPLTGATWGAPVRY